MRTGRPKLAASLKREKPLRIRCNPIERAMLDRAAGCNTATWARLVLLRAAKRAK